MSAAGGARVIASEREAVAAATAYAAAIRPQAVARDRERRLPHDELRELARSGLLGIGVPRAHGGAGASSATVAEVFRLISAADPAVGQIPQNHFAFVELLVRNGSEAQRARFMPEFLRGARLGNALSERGGRTARDWVTRLVRQPDGDYRLNGRKYYSTGALTAQWIPVFALDDADEVAVAYVPRDAPGVTVEQDWTAFGQRATFSGTTVLDAVRVPAEQVVSRALSGKRDTTFAAFGQLMHVAVDVGIARGALDDGAAFLRERARPWWEAEVDRAADDPQLIRLAGELDARVRAAEALLAQAAVALDRADALTAALDAQQGDAVGTSRAVGAAWAAQQGDAVGTSRAVRASWAAQQGDAVGTSRAVGAAWAAGDDTSGAARSAASDAAWRIGARALTEAELAEAELAAVTEARLQVAAAKAFGGETALAVATAIFDFSGSSAADERHGLDRHWRNARTHTLHDPARSKHLHLGRHLVDGVAPPAGHSLI